MGKMAKFEEAYFKHYAFLRAILSSGNGKTSKSAYVVISPSDEYNLVYFLGFSTKGQRLISEDNKSFDVLECSIGEQLIDVYFNIEVSFNSLKNILK